MFALVIRAEVIMKCWDHIRVARLMDAATGKSLLTEPEVDHVVECEACQDVLEILIRELRSPSPNASNKSVA